MRISDWSSDVCSSDLHIARTFRRRRPGNFPPCTLSKHWCRAGASASPCSSRRASMTCCFHSACPETCPASPSGSSAKTYRKSVVKGECVAVRVDPGGRRFLKQQHNRELQVAQCVINTEKAEN